MNRLSGKLLKELHSTFSVLASFPVSIGHGELIEIREQGCDHWISRTIDSSGSFLLFLWPISHRRLHFWNTQISSTVYSYRFTMYGAYTSWVEKSWIIYLNCRRKRQIQRDENGGPVAFQICSLFLIELFIWIIFFLKCVIKKIEITCNTILLRNVLLIKRKENELKF